MTRDDAARVAAQWWADAFDCGNWDNGDAHTESVHSAFRAIGYQPTQEDRRNIRGAMPTLIGRLLAEDEQRPYARQSQVYSDYGNQDIDEMLKQINPKMSCLLHGPQKAGTTISWENGEYKVHAKDGYGKPHRDLEPAKVATTS